MVQRIKSRTYRCHFCKTIYKKMKDAEECENECVEEDSDESIMKRDIKQKYWNRESLKPSPKKGENKNGMD